VEGYFDGSEERLIEFLRGSEQAVAVAVGGAVTPIDDDSRIDTVLL